MWSPLQTLLFRVDRSTRGSGEGFLRCLALAQTWVDSGGRVVFVNAAEDSITEARLTAEDVESISIGAISGSVQDAQVTAELAMEWESHWVVVCGPQFDAAYQRVLKNAGLRVFLISNAGQSDRCEADLVLNQGLFADESLYPDCDRGAQLLLGPRYALLRRDFVRWSHWQRNVPDVAQHVLVTYADSEDSPAAIKTIQALADANIPGLEAIVVTPLGGTQDPRIQAVALHVPMRVRVRPNITAMPGLLSWADIAVTQSEPPCEWLFMGLPSLFVVLSPEQRASAERLAAMRVGMVLGHARAMTSVGFAQRLEQVIGSWEDRDAMASECRGLVDGQGAERVRMRLLGSRIRLRKAAMEDCELLWHWMNDPGVRANSLTPDAIAWNDHVEWFTKKQRDPRCCLFLGVDHDDAPVGFVRFDITGRAAHISVGVDEQYRGMGYGRCLVEQGAVSMFRRTWVTEIHATFMPTCEASARLFAACGFETAGIQIVNGQEARHCVLSRNRAMEMGKHRIVPK